MGEGMTAKVYTPDNPSTRAMSRFGDAALPAPTVCPYCGAPVTVKSHIQTYGKTYGDWPWLYACTQCDASVGMHPKTNIPLGTLADKTLRQVRTACKQPFELLWKDRCFSRTEAYQKLAEHLGIDSDKCHFGMFDAYTCKLARDWAVSQLRRKV
jgi:DNA-directed RNA polymerase subunit RPC12/RpoP